MHPMHIINCMILQNTWKRKSQKYRGEDRTENMKNIVNALNKWKYKAMVQCNREKKYIGTKNET